MTNTASKNDTGVAAINSRGDVWLFIDEKSAPFTRVIVDRERVTIDGEQPVSKVYPPRVLQALHRVPKVTVALIDKKTSQVLELDDLDVVLEGVEAAPAV